MTAHLPDILLEPSLEQFELGLRMVLRVKEGKSHCRTFFGIELLHEPSRFFEKLGKKISFIPHVLEHPTERYGFPRLEIVRRAGPDKLVHLRLVTECFGWLLLCFAHSEVF